jgi:hypothetical protein
MPTTRSEPTLPLRANTPSNSSLGLIAPYRACISNATMPLKCRSRARNCREHGRRRCRRHGARFRRSAPLRLPPRRWRWTMTDMPRRGRRNEEEYMRRSWVHIADDYTSGGQDRPAVCEGPAQRSRAMSGPWSDCRVSSNRSRPGGPGRRPGIDVEARSGSFAVVGSCDEWVWRDGPVDRVGHGA